MIVAAAGGQRRPRYVLGIVVGVLIVAAYALTQSKPTAPAPAPTPTLTPTAASSAVSVVVQSPARTLIPIEIIVTGPGLIDTPPPVGGIERGGKPRPMPRP